MPLVKENRRDTGDAYSFNWSMRIAPDLQMPFEPSHENMANLKLYPDQPVEVLAADLRRAFSGIVAGNVKEVGIRAIEEFGPYKINGDKEIMRRMDDLLQGFVAQHRMKLPGSAYIPCYESARNLRSPGDVCCRVFSFLVTYSSTHFICYMNVSYHPHATNIITVNMSYNLYCNANVSLFS
ncbi:putative decarboxylase [Escherichia coli]|nr:putative decarboxylase [Escherichia coli]